MADRGGKPSDAAAAAAFLRVLSARLRPLMKHVAVKIRKERSEGESGKARGEALGWGIVIIDDFTDDGDDDSRSASGAFGGSRLVLMREGRLVEQSRIGRWDSRGGSWRSTTIRDLTPEQAAAEWTIDPSEILSHVEEAIRQSAGKYGSTVRMLDGRLGAVRAALEAADAAHGRDGLLSAAEALEKSGREDDERPQGDEDD